MRDKMVCVEWDDAGFNSGYYDKDSKTRFRPVRTKTIGFVIKSDRQCVIISHERFYKEDGKLEDERHITTIPRAMTRKIVQLKEK